MSGFWQGYVELTLARVKYEARYEIVDDMVHLTVVDRLTVIVEPLPGATNEESALYALEQFATGKIRAPD